MDALIAALSSLVIGLLVWDLRLTYTLHAKVSRMQLALFGNGDSIHSPSLPLINTIEALNDRVTQLERGRVKIYKAVKHE